MRVHPLLLITSSCALIACNAPATSEQPPARSLASASPGKSDSPREGIQDFFFKDQDLPGSLEASGVSVLPGDEQVTIVLLTTILRRSLGSPKPLTDSKT